MTDRPIRWLLHFELREGEQSYKRKEQPGFPTYETEHPTRDACKGEAVRVLNKLW